MAANYFVLRANQNMYTIDIMDQRERGQWAFYYTSSQSFLIRWLNNFGDYSEF